MNKKIFIKIILFIIIFILAICNICFATTSIDLEMLDELQEKTQNIDINDITEEDILNLYDDLSENYTTEDIAEIIEENKSEIEKQGISSDIIDAGTEILRTTDSETVREIIKEDIDINDIKTKIEEGYSANEIVESIVKEIPTEQKLNIVTKLFFANAIIKTILTLIAIVFIYDTILRAIIYHKAGKHAWAAIIPIYRDVVMYQISDINPWLILLWFVPIIGWIILFGVWIIRKICLPLNFGRGPIFALGNVLFPMIFESIIAFNPNIKYKNEVK